MRAFLKRAAALPAAALGAVALVGMGAGAAHATVASGSVTLTINGSFIASLAKAGVVVVPQNEASVTFTPSTDTVAITYTATGGTASLVSFSGVVDYSGSILGFSCRGKSVDLSSLMFDLTNGVFDGKTGAGAETPLVDLSGTQSGDISGTTQTYNASDLTIDAAGAQLLDTALHTSAFVAGTDIGSFAATWTTS
jgi:hypothetical protein